MKKNIVALILVVLMAPFVVLATEHLIPLQGYASDSSSKPVNNGDISVRIYDAPLGGSIIYNSGANFNGAIEKGIYDVVLGSITPLDLDNTIKYYMEIDINGEEVVGDATSGREAFWPGGGNHSPSWNHLSNIPPGFADGIDNTGSTLWSQSGNDIYTDNNVGIGAPPNSKLEVVGNSLITNGSVIINGSKPRLTGRINTTGYAYDVLVSGDLAYVADGMRGLRILNVSDPSSPSFVGFFDSGDYGWGVALQDDLAYLAAGNDGLQIINISNPSSPALTGSYDTGDYVRDVQVLGNQTYFADRNGALQIINITNPSVPNLWGQTSIPGSPYRLFLKYPYAYVASVGAGVYMCVISDPYSPYCWEEYHTGTAVDIWISGDLLYVANHFYGLEIVNISEIALPQVVSIYPLESNASGVYVDGDYAYMASSSGLEVIDVSDPYSPTFAYKYDLESPAENVVVYKNFTYLADFNEGLQIIEVPDDGGGDFTVTRNTYLEGKVGIGTHNPKTILEVSSVLRLTPTDNPGTCTTEIEGSIYYDSSLHKLCYCSYSGWKQADGGGDC